MSNLEQTLSIIKPDAVERNLQEEIKKFLLKMDLILKMKKKIQISKVKPKNFIKYINPNHFIMNFVIIFLQDQ